MVEASEVTEWRGANPLRLWFVAAVVAVGLALAAVGAMAASDGAGGVQGDRFVLVQESTPEAGTSGKANGRGCQDRVPQEDGSATEQTL